MKVEVEENKCLNPSLNRIKMMNNKGVTLIELAIVVSIIAILIIAVGFSFEGWVGRYKVEGQMKEIYGDLMNARAKAMSKSRVYFVTLATNSYTIYEDTNPVPDGNGTLETGTDDSVTQRNLATGYPIKWSDPQGDTQIDFSTKGLSSDNKIICSNTSYNADYSCIVISSTRINIGQLTTAGGACDASNCVVK